MLATFQMDDYTPRSPDLSTFTFNQSDPQQHVNDHHDHHQHFQHDQSRPDTTSTPSSYLPYPLPRQDSFSLPQSSYYQPPPPASAQPPQSSSYILPSQEPVKVEPVHDLWMPTSTDNDNGVGTAPQSVTKPGKKQSAKSTQPQQQPAEPRLPAPGDAENIVVRTKFPVARIKRIVQADEEVGKVAQVTPPVVGKALELFMIQMTLAAVAEARGSKRLTAAHIKAAISKDDKFDFLKDIGDRIPEGPAAKGESKRHKTERHASDEDGDHAWEEGTKAKRKPVTRKKRRTSDEA